MYNDSRPISPHHENLLASGATWLRIDVLWSETEPTNVAPEEYNWTYADHVFGAGLGQSGVRMIGTIRTAPSWAVNDATKPDGPIKSEHLPDFLDFVGALVERFDGDGNKDAPGSPIVEYWEFYNEPDRRLNASMGRWGEYGAEYAHMLSLVYPVVKQHNPSAQVVFGGIAYDWFEDQNGPFVRTFLDDVLAAGGGNYFDVFNFHAYPLYNIFWTPGGRPDMGPGLLQKTQFLRAKLNAAGLNKPIIITEAGWHSNENPGQPQNLQGSDEIQSRYVVQLFTQSLAADIDVMIWWMLIDPVGHGNENGLTTAYPPPQRKPSFLAYQTIVNMLTGKPFARALSADELNNNPSLEAYKFSNPAGGQPIYIAWLNPIDHGNSTTLAIAAEEVRTFDIYGNLLDRLVDEGDSADDGQVSVSVNSQPLYIEVIR